MRGVVSVAVEVNDCMGVYVIGAILRVCDVVEEHDDRSDLHIA